jgi:hypothetical protein
MTETQLRLFPAFKTLPVYDESDERSHSFTTGMGKGIRECVTMTEVEECLANPKLVPVGAVRVGETGKNAVVVYFSQMT